MVSFFPFNTILRLECVDLVLGLPFRRLFTLLFLFIFLRLLPLGFLDLCFRFFGLLVFFRSFMIFSMSAIWSCGFGRRRIGFSLYLALPIFVDRGLVISRRGVEVFGGK